MPTLREYNLKLGRLRSTRKITKTMKMVAASKLHKAQESLRACGEFRGRLEGLLDDAWWPRTRDDLFLLGGATRSRRAILLVVTSDKGLCGGFNSNIGRHAMRWLDENARRFEEVEVRFCGRKGQQYFKNRQLAGLLCDGLVGRSDHRAVAALTAGLIGQFRTGRCGEVYVAYNRFRNALSQTPHVERILPFDPGLSADGGVASGRVRVNRLYFPDSHQVIDGLIEQLARLRMYAILLESVAGENAARMTAMENSTANAEKLIEEYTLLRNRARQAAITRELTEIISGAEAIA